MKNSNDDTYVYGILVNDELPKYSEYIKLLCMNTPKNTSTISNLARALYLPS